MKHRTKILSLFKHVLGIAGIVFCSLGQAQDTGNSLADSFFKPFNDGKASLLLNYRFEHVDDPTKTKNANASTLRTVLGYKTARTYSIATYVEIENVHAIGNVLYNDGGTNGKTSYPVVVDPEGTEINEAYISLGLSDSFALLKDTEIKLGRQLISYRNGPFHRFVGPVVWRQNWQSFDGYTLSNKSLKDTHFRMAYIHNVNRIFGEDNPNPIRHDKDVDGFMFNVQYGGSPIGQLEAYAHLLDFKNTAASPAGGFFQSTATYGVRINGKHAISPKTKLLYAGEYAHQSDYQTNPFNIDSNYFQGELGMAFDQVGPILQSATLKVGYELLSGSGSADRFTTPLATLHAYQGWADKFLNTPGDGIEDIYIAAIAKVSGFNLTMVYHDLSSDNDGYDYGTEFDVVVSKSFKTYFTAGLKYADYSADRNTLNVARNADQSNDINKFWAFLQFKY